MKDATELKAGDPCPSCGGEMVVDRAQHPDVAIEHHRKVNPTNPAVCVAYERDTRDKAAASGVIHACRSCRYQARFAEASGKAKGSRAA
jgi:hypothetical protein